MAKISYKLTVYFEDPFWVGVFEHTTNGKLSVCKVTFGKEPKDVEVLTYILKYDRRLKFSQAVNVVEEKTKTNPKKRQRDVRKQMLQKGIGTKSQQAIKMQQEQNKQERKAKTKEQKEVEAKRLFELKQQKKLEKHKGH